MIAPVTAATDSAVPRPRGAQELRCRHASWRRELHRPRPRAGKLCWRTSEREEHRRPLGTSPARSPRPRRRPPASVPRKTPSLSTLAEDYFKDNSNAAPCEPVAGERSSTAVLEEEALRELVLGAGVARRRLRANGSHWPLHGPAMASAGFGLASTGSRPGRQAPPELGPPPWLTDGKRSSLSGAPDVSACVAAGRVGGASASTTAPRRRARLCRTVLGPSPTATPPAAAASSPPHPALHAAGAVPCPPRCQGRGKRRISPHRRQIHPRRRWTWTRECRSRHAVLCPGLRAAGTRCRGWRPVPRPPRRRNTKAGPPRRAPTSKPPDRDAGAAAPCPASSYARAVALYRPRSRRRLPGRRPPPPPR